MMEKHEQGVERLNETVKKVVTLTAVSLCVLAVVFFLVFPEPMPQIYGLAAGGVLGLFAFLDLKNSLIRSSVMVPHKAKAYAAFRYFIRFAVTAAVLALVFRSPYVEVLGSICGFLAIKAVIYLIHIFNDKTYFSKIFGREK